MATLSRLHRWLQYVPDLGDNRELPQPFYLEVASGLTKLQLADYFERMRGWSQARHESTEGMVEGLEALLAPHVRMGKEALVIDGAPVTSLRAYLALVANLLGESPLFEMLRLVPEYNQVMEGPKATFSARLSGGSASTPTPSTERADARTASP